MICPAAPETLEAHRVTYTSDLASNEQLSLYST